MNNTTNPFTIKNILTCGAMITIGAAVGGWMVGESPVNFTISDTFNMGNELIGEYPAETATVEFDGEVTQF